MSTSMRAAKRSSQMSFTITGEPQKVEFQRNNPMHPKMTDRLTAAPRCLARTRKGTACQSPAVRGKRRCRMHGGANPGAPKGNRNARKHGGYSAETMAAVRYLEMIARIVKY